MIIFSIVGSQKISVFIFIIQYKNKYNTRRRLVAEATRRSSDLILKESFLSQVLLPKMHEIVDDVQDVLCFCR